MEHIKPTYCINRMLFLLGETYENRDITLMKCYFYYMHYINLSIYLYTYKTLIILIV